MSVTEIAIKRPTLIVVIFAVLGLLGIASYTKLNYELIPKMNMPMISVVTTYPGASANEVESSVTKVLEDALSSLEKVKNITSTSQEGVSIISVELNATADATLSSHEAQQKINQILTSLPENAGTPSLSKFSTDELPVLRLSVSGKISPIKLYELTEDQIKAQLSNIDGVGQVSLVGGTERQIRVKINKNTLDAYHISISQIYQAILKANMEMPTGKIEGSLKQYTVRLLGKVKSIYDLENIVVSKSPTGQIVKLSDIAEVSDGVAEPTTISRINKNDAIGINISKQSDANSVDVCQKVKLKLSELETQYASSGLKFEVASDNSVYTLSSANAVMEDLMFAVFLVACVMFLFLHSIRNSFIVLISIPTSIISVFIGMYIFDFTLNSLTLMALSLVVGILVDDSIVVLENIYRHMEMGKNRRIAALEGRTEIGFTAIAITMVDIVVFLPLSLVNGMIGNLLREFSLVIVFSTLMSLFVSFTVTPLLASRFGKIEEITRKTLIGRFALWFESTYTQINKYYIRILTWSLEHRKTVYAFVTVLIIFSFSLLGFGLIGTAFMNEGDRGEFMVKLEGESLNTLHQTSILTSKVEDLLLSKPEVVKVYSNIGSSSSSMNGTTNEQYKSEITVTIVPKQERTIGVDEYAANIKKEALAIPGLKVSSTPSSVMGTADDAPIQVLLRGADLEKLYLVADSIMPLMKKIPGINDLKLSVDKNKPELQIKLDRERMELLGLNVQQVGNIMNMAFAGNSILKYSEGDKEYDINIQFDKFDRNKIEDLGGLTFQNDMGKIVELRDFATIHQALGPNKLERSNRISSLTIKASVFGRPIGTVGGEVKSMIGENFHPNDYSIEYIGQMERQADAFGSLLIAIVAALIFVYLVMVALYNSYFYPFVVLFSIPVAVIGALLALALSGEEINIFAIIGMIMLIGLVAKNAILLVDFTNKLRAEGRSVKEALVEAGKDRLRPILMTTLSMVFGMLPIALASGDGAESKNGLAWVIIGGLISSLLLTLVLVPSVYASLETYKEKFGRRFNKEKVEPVKILVD